MAHLIHDIKNILKKPRLLIKYFILNVFLFVIGTGAVMYIKKEAAVDYQRDRSTEIGEAAHRMGKPKQFIPDKIETETRSDPYSPGENLDKDDCPDK